MQQTGDSKIAQAALAFLFDSPAAELGRQASYRLPLVQLESHSSDLLGRTVFSGATSSLAALADEFEPPSRHFVLLIAADTSRIDGPTLVGHAETLIRRGASYVCCWGPGCSRFHDVFDEADLSINGESTDDRFIFTTWHEDEPLEEAVWFTLNSTFPARAYASTTTSVVALAIGNPEWGMSLQTYLAAGAPIPDDA